MKETTVPKVVAYAQDAMSVWVQCPYCLKIHGHGRETPWGTNLGHRHADCANTVGYIIAEIVELSQVRH